MLTNSDVENFISKNNYDIRVSGNGRWIDQKCAADVLTIVSDCIYNFYISKVSKQKFTTSDIWHSEYAEINVEDVFRKPKVDSKKAKHEYDKFFQQPMELLAAANVLNKQKNRGQNIYSIANLEIIEYIALREKNALFFLKVYIEKTLRDSGIYYLFESFFKDQTSLNYLKMKKGFSNFTIQYTKINGIVECNRIFIKVLNPLAYYNKSLGTERGYLSKHNITYDKLMYNRDNFRDIYAEKPKNLTRKEYIKLHKIEPNSAYCTYQSNKAKHYLHLFNEKYRCGKSEHFDDLAQGEATHIHHIFTKSQYPEICSYLENLIALTPSQHLTKAHPSGRTREISEMYQHMLLLSKNERIKENIMNDKIETIYNFKKFLYVLSVGFDNSNIFQIEENDFNSVINLINSHYVA